MSLAWGNHRNGRIPERELARAVNFFPLWGEPVGPLASCLRSDAARQWFVADAHYFATKGRHLTLSEGYRSYPDQENRYSIFLRVGHPLAAYPGTSGHGWGLSADVGTEGRAWLTVNGPRFGWHPTGRSFSRPEPWHFDYLGGGDITKTPDEINGAGQKPPKLLPASNGDNMIQATIKNAKAKAGEVRVPDNIEGYIADISDGFLHHSGSIAEADITRAVISNPDERHELSWVDFQRVCLSHGIDRQFIGQPTDLLKLDQQPWGGRWSQALANEQTLVRLHEKVDALTTALILKK